MILTSLCAPLATVFRPQRASLLECCKNGYPRADRRAKVRSLVERAVASPSALLQIVSPQKGKECRNPLCGVGLQSST